MTIAEFKDYIRPCTIEMLHRLGMRETLASWVCTDPPFDIEKYLNCIVFECIYRAHEENAPTSSIRRHMINNGEEYDNDDDSRPHSQVTRTMKKVKENREERFAQLYRRYKIEPEELLRHDSFLSMAERKVGYQLTENEYRQKKNIERLHILKKIDERQICDTHHYPNKRHDIGNDRRSLKRDMQEYEEHFETVFSSAITPEEYILAAIEFFMVESHYFIEFAYALSVALTKKEEEGPVAIPSEAICLLCNAAHSSTGIKTDSRFIVGRMDLIQTICDGNDWDILRSKIHCFLRGKIILFCSITIGDEEESLVHFFDRNIDINEQARFISEDYKIQEIIHTTKAENWSDAQIRNFRKIYESVIRKKEVRQQDIAIGNNWKDRDKN